ISPARRHFASTHRPEGIGFSGPIRPNGKTLRFESVSEIRGEPGGARLCPKLDIRLYDRLQEVPCSGEVVTMASQSRKPVVRENNRGGEEMRFVVGQSSLGSILVASSDKGVVSILISEEPGRLLADLQSRFPQAYLVPGGRADDDLLMRLVDFVEEPTPYLEL